MNPPLPPLELCRGGMPLTYSAAYPPDSEMGRHLAATRWFDPDDAHRSYVRAGAELRDAIIRLLPRDWNFEGKRTLDFGCGGGRILRHFIPEAERAEVWGCDIDRPSIEWLEQNLCPPLHALVNDEEPPLRFPDGHFDLVWAYSVFTHLKDSWARWCCELHRVLAPNGLAVVTFVSSEMASFLLRRRFDEDRIGMLVRSAGAPSEVGGPLVIHSEWWIRAHWGRAFEVLDICPITTSDPPPIRQTVAVMRRRQVAVTPDGLEAPEPGDSREIEARREQVRDLRASAEMSVIAHRAAVEELESSRDRLWASYREQVEVRDREAARRKALEERGRAPQDTDRGASCGSRSARHGAPGD